MKKLLTLFLSIALLAASSTVLCSCNVEEPTVTEDEDKDKDDDKKKKGETTAGTKEINTEEMESSTNNEVIAETKDPSVPDSHAVADFVSKYNDELIELFEDEFGTGDDSTILRAATNSITVEMKINGVSSDSWTDEDTEMQMESFEDRLNEEGILDEAKSGIEDEIDGDKVPEQLEKIAVKFYTEDGSYLFTLTLTNDGATCEK